MLKTLNNLSLTKREINRSPHKQFFVIPTDQLVECRNLKLRSVPYPVAFLLTQTRVELGLPMWTRKIT